MRDFPGMSRASDIDDWTFTQILGALPDTPAVIRAYLMVGYGVLVSSDDPQVWWNALVQDRRSGHPRGQHFLFPSQGPSTTAGSASSYPQLAAYTGSGSTAAAENFVCRLP